MLVSKIRDKLIKEKPVTKNSRKVSGIKATHGSKILSNVKKKIKKVTIYRPRFVQSFMHLIFVHFEAWLVK